MQNLVKSFFHKITCKSKKKTKKLLTADAFPCFALKFLWIDLFSLIQILFHQYTSPLQVNVQQCLISFKPEAHCRDLELYFFNKWFKDECVCFFGRNSWCLHTLWFWKLNKNEVLTVSKPHFYLCLTCV